MKTKKFVLQIEMGNDAVKDAEDLIGLLRKVEKHLGELRGKDLRPVHSRRVFDTNGNRVGTWGIEETYE